MFPQAGGCFFSHLGPRSKLRPRPHRSHHIGHHVAVLPDISITVTTQGILFGQIRHILIIFILYRLFPSL
jgi:hypothetical protein